MSITKVPSEMVLLTAANYFTPAQFGAIGDGVADDGLALNAMFAAVRAVANAAGNISNIQLNVDMTGGKYRTTIPINATGIVAWSLEIKGGLLIGECTGKAILDLVGSRGYTLQNVAFFGSKANRPSCAYQLARPTAAGFCDNNSFVEVSTTGWFSRAAIHCYGHETTKHDHCTYFNYDHTGRVAIFEGYDGTPFTSDYTTVMSGPTSFINNKVTVCDFRYLPVDENIVAITGVTNAASGVITCPGHQFAINDLVVFASVGGMPNMAKQTATITAVTATTVTINVDTTSLGAYTSGGSMIRRQTKSPVYLSRAQQFNFDCSYIVGYGQPQLEIAFPDSTRLRMEQIDLDLLLEGSGNNSNILFNLFSSVCNIQGFRFKTYNGNAVAAWFGLSAGTLSIYQAELQYLTPLYGSSIPIAGGGQEANLAVYGGNAAVTGLTAIPYAGMAAYKGFITEIGTGNFYSRGLTAL